MSLSIAFTKMHGLGNDFVIINTLNHKLEINPKVINKLGDTKQGIGFDQLLLIEPSTNADFFCRIFNKDGSEAEQCGNGLRCVARYLHENKLHNNNDLTIATRAGIFPITMTDYDHISVTLGIPEIVDLHCTLKSKSLTYPLSLITIGNPHAILRVDHLNPSVILSEGKDIATHPHFKNGINVGFLQIVDQQQANLRTFERGAGETLACGSNATAAAVAAIQQGWLTGKTVQINFLLGSLFVTWEGEGKPVTLMGPATRVFEGIF